MAIRDSEDDMQGCIPLSQASKWIDRVLRNRDRERRISIRDRERRKSIINRRWSQKQEIRWTFTTQPQQSNTRRKKHIKENSLLANTDLPQNIIYPHPCSEVGTDTLTSSKGGRLPPSQKLRKAAAERQKNGWFSQKKRKKKEVLLLSNIERKSGIIQSEFF